MELITIHCTVSAGPWGLTALSPTLGCVTWPQFSTEVILAALEREALAHVKFSEMTLPKAALPVCRTCSPLVCGRTGS